MKSSATNVSKKGTLSAWLNEEEKTLWRKLAAANAMTVSAFTTFSIREILREALQDNDSKKAFTATQTTEAQEKRCSVKVRLTESEIEAVKRLSEQRGQSRQDFIVSAIRQMILGVPQIDEHVHQSIIDSTLELNKIGINLNQIARVLNTQAKVGEVGSDEIDDAIEAVSQMDDHINQHIKRVDKFFDRHYRRKKILFLPNSH